MTLARSQRHHPIAIEPLEAKGPAALHELRRTLGLLLGEVGPTHRAVDLAEVMSLNRSLAWKIWRVAQGPDELPSPKHIPGRAAMESFLRATQSRGASRTTLDAVRRAYDDFESLSKRHGGDRASADILLGGFTGEGRSRMEIQLRRDAFRANSHILGVRMRTRHQLDILAPSPDGHMPLQARVRGCYGLQRTRADARWVLSRSYVIQRSGTTSNYRRTPLAPDLPVLDGQSPVPILPAFCSPTNLPLLRHEGSNDTVVDELGPSPIGASGAADIVTGELLSDIPHDNVRQDAMAINVRTPSERLCYEICIHRDILRGTTPTLDVYTTLNALTPQDQPDPRDRVPISEQLRALGRADLSPPAVEVPRHAELVAWTFDRLGWQSSDFLVFRFSMRFPPIPILIWARYQVQ